MKRMLSSQVKAEMWYDLGVGVWTKFLDMVFPLSQSLSANQCLRVGLGIFNFYNYISRWIDAIDVVIGSVKKLCMLLLCLAR